MSKETIGVVGQWSSLFISLTGIIIEIKYGAHIGHILITTAAVLLAVSTKIKYYRSH